MAKSHLPLLFGVQLLLAFSLGCGSSGTMSPPPPPPPQSDFLYLLTFPPPPATSMQLMSFKLDIATGTLTSTSTSNVSLLPGIAVDPTSKFLYLSDSNPIAPAIDIFSIDPKTGVPTPDGALILTKICPFCAPVNGPGPLAMDPKGNFFYYGSNFMGTGVTQVVGGLSGAGTATLSEISGSPFAADDVPFGILVHPSGHFLYTENVPAQPVFPLPLQSISGFSIDSSSGALTPVPGSPFVPSISANLSGFATHPAGKFLYASTGQAASGILAWSIDGTSGVLTPLLGSPFASGTALLGVTLSTSGKFLYSANLLEGGLSGFTVDAGTGTLTPMPGLPFAAGKPLFVNATDPSGKFLVAVDAQDQTLLVLSIDPSTGALTQIGTPKTLNSTALGMLLTRAPQ